jgi:molecular chaperone DnaK (HSP70)
VPVHITSVVNEPGTLDGRVRVAHGARFCVGIDLGTTNSALAFVPLDRDGESEILTIPQWDSPGVMADAPTLPSFLYLPEAEVVNQLAGQKAGEGGWLIGRLARTMAAECPGRVAHSTKSWLCHHAADRSAAFLPWRSEEIAGEQKISPVRASALILAYLRDVWNARYAGAGADFAFDSQVITLTVPASFDAVAQRLTLAAAQEAGFPETVCLLEEPQAAFSCWLERHDVARAAWANLSNHNAGPYHVLVVDIGGGTSDFSLFEFRPNDGSRRSGIERVAVGDHILLGGDNMDLAIAHRLEPQLVDDGERLSGGQWRQLVARCRDVKEKALSTAGPPDEAFGVSIPGRGSSLAGGVRSSHLARAEIEQLLLDGFFPECYADDSPIQTKAPLGEWGLSYAPDPAVTRHLANFLRGRPAVGAVLFNGGSLHPWPLRQRICREIGKWQGGATPIVLENPEPDFAVAHGAARFGKIMHSRAERVDVGPAYPIFLEAPGMPAAEVDENGEPSIVGVLPTDASSEVTFTYCAPELPAGRRGWLMAECSREVEIQGLPASSVENEQAVFQQRVQERAYALWEVEGRAEGRHLDHWTQAELEIEATPTAASGVESGPGIP